MSTKLKTAIIELAKKASDAAASDDVTRSQDALNFSQAANNLANAMASMGHNRREDQKVSRPPE